MGRKVRSGKGGRYVGIGGGNCGKTGGIVQDVMRTTVETVSEVVSGTEGEDNAFGERHFEN